MQIDNDYKNGWRYIVWVGGVDDYYVNYKDAKRDADEWKDKGYNDVIIEQLKEYRQWVDIVLIRTALIVRAL